MAMARTDHACGCYAEMSRGRSETPEHQLKSLGDNPESSATPRGNPKASQFDGPFGGKKPQS